MADLGGLNPYHAVAGFGGGVAALPFIPPGGKIVALGYVTAGLCVSMFLTPLLAEVLAGPHFLGSALSQRAELGLAFLLGLTAMITIPIVLGALGWVRDNIAALMRRITGTDGKGAP